ncbi:hypothetical protein [Streptomyces sp. NBC_01198]|uniref:hypothetical protein n=1 Tax=Streptomyces sp. NBC_01198 TaxID=2903769 RepID=UPI002E125F04|nr:hypothetical protein OG702_23015 [Streptomyces sp. NBC_01198]
MSKTSLVRLAAAGTVAGVLAVGAAACGPADDSASSAASAGSTGGKAGGTASSAPASAAAKKKEGKPAVKPAFKGDGTFQVGTDIQPGTYRTSGNDDGMCYWERAKDAKGGTDSILANDNVTGSSYVTIKKTDKIFKTTDCKDWFAAGAEKSGAPKTSMPGDGMFKVGTDIAAGTYKTSGGDACYWERTKDALHDVDSIAANDNVTGKGVVTIGSRDAYFKTSGCGKWTKTD